MRTNLHTKKFILFVKYIFIHKYIRIFIYWKQITYLKDLNYKKLGMMYSYLNWDNYNILCILIPNNNNNFISEEYI